MVGEGDVEPICLLSGDPERVRLIATYLQNSEELAHHRGLVTFRGQTKRGTDVTISTTGMGGPSCAIVLEELRRLGAKLFIRIGSCGGLPLKVKLGDLVIPFGAVRDESTSLNYAPNTFPAVVSPEIFSNLVEACKKRDIRFHTGLVWTSDVFYPFSNSEAFSQWNDRNVLAVEMESSVLFTFAQVFGLASGSILACDGNLQVNPKGELESEQDKIGELHPALKAAVKLECEIAIDTIDRLRNDIKSNNVLF